MNCQSFETVVNDLAREQMMEATAREEALAHSGVCEACALRLALERRLSSALRALAEEMNSVSASARVEEQLLNVFRGQTALLPQTRSASGSRYWLVAAAVVLIAFGIAGMKWGLDRESQNVIEASSNTGVPTPSKSPVVVKDQSKREAASKVVAYRPRRKRSVRSPRKSSSGENEASVAQMRAGGTNTSDASDSADSEVTTQFLPLSYVSAGNLQDGGGQLVRVELPRSAMARFGLPVNMERYGERVKADVLISADGLARAIRFVQ